MTAALCLFAALAGTASGLFLYLASRNQRLLARPGPPRRNLILAAGAGLACLGALLRVVGPASAVYILLTLLMAVLTLAPFLAALGAGRRGRP